MKHKSLILAILAGSQFLVVLDATIVDVALPSIRDALHFVNMSQLQWVVTAYSIAFGGLLLLGGRLADIIGRRKVFLAGITVFTIASIFAGISQSSDQLIICRVIQGIGAALLSPAAFSLILSNFKEGQERNRALGIWGAIVSGGSAVGLLLGGVLTSYVNWRWIFLINIFVGIAIILLASKYIPKDGKQGNDVSHDVTGAVTITVGIMVLVYAFTVAGSDGWSNPSTIGLFLLSIASICAFIFNELRVKHPLVSLGIFKEKNISVGLTIQFIISVGIMSMFFYIMQYMQNILNYSPIRSGLLMLPMTIVIAVVSEVISRKMSLISSRIFLTTSSLLIVIGLLLFARLPLDGSFVTDLLPGMIISGIGMGIMFVVGPIAITNGIKKEDSGMVSGLLTTSQQIGGAIGLAVLTSLAASHTANISASADLLGSYHYIFIVAAGVSFLSVIVAMCLLPKQKS